MRIVVLFLALVASTVVGVVLLLSMTGWPETPAVDQAPAGQPDDTAVVPVSDPRGPIHGGDRAGARTRRAAQ